MQFRVEKTYLAASPDKEEGEFAFGAALSKVASFYTCTE
jgi:hypothetical protein